MARDVNRMFSITIKDIVKEAQILQILNIRLSLQLVYDEPLTVL